MSVSMREMPVIKGKDAKRFLDEEKRVNEDLKLFAKDFKNRINEKQSEDDQLTMNFFELYGEVIVQLSCGKKLGGILLEEKTIIQMRCIKDLIDDNVYNFKNGSIYNADIYQDGDIIVVDEQGSLHFFVNNDNWKSYFNVI